MASWPTRRAGASEKDRFVAIRDHLKRQRERCETDVSSQPIAVDGAVSSYPVAGLSASECQTVLARHTTAKFADVLDKFSLNQLKWREDQSAMDV